MMMMMMVVRVMQLQLLCNPTVLRVRLLAYPGHDLVSDLLRSSTATTSRH
jgi:hypothetical protein